MRAGVRNVPAEGVLFTDLKEAGQSSGKTVQGQTGASGNRSSEWPWKVAGRARWRVGGLAPKGRASPRPQVNGALLTDHREEEHFPHFV